MIERTAPAQERANLLAVTQVLMGLRYNDPQLLAIFGGRAAMIESPVLKELEQEWKAEATAEAMVKAKVEDILSVLDARLGPPPPDVQEAVRGIQDVPRLDALVREAGR